MVCKKGKDRYSKSGVVRMGVDRGKVEKEFKGGIEIVICVSVYIYIHKHLGQKVKQNLQFNTIKVSCSCLPNVKQKISNKQPSLTATAQNKRINSR